MPSRGTRDAVGFTAMWSDACVGTHRPCRDAALRQLSRPPAPTARIEPVIGRGSDQPGASDAREETLFDGIRHRLAGEARRTRLR